MRRAQHEDTHALKQHRLSRNSSPFCSSFVLVIVSDMHLEPESQKRAKNEDFHTAENIQIQATLFFVFLDEFFERELVPTYCSQISAAKVCTSRCLSQRNKEAVHSQPFVCLCLTCCKWGINYTAYVAPLPLAVWDVGRGRGQRYIN